MKARYLISMLAALASPALVSAQAPDGGPSGPPPHHHQEFGPSDGRPDGSPSGWGEQHHHHHHHRMMHADGMEQADGQSGDPRERFMHVRAAIENLRAAGMNEEAERVEMAAHKMREEFMQRRQGDHQHEGGPPMQGRHEHGNFGGAPQGYDVHAQLEHLMRDVQQLRAEVNQMRAGHRDGAGPQGGPREFSGQPWGEHRQGGHHDGVDGNESPHGMRPQGGHSDGVNPPGPGPQPQANGPQGHPGGPFPRPEWRNHRGPNQDGGQPPARPQGDRPPGPGANEPANANEESLQDSAIEAPASTPGN